MAVANGLGTSTATALSQTDAREATTRACTMWHARYSTACRPTHPRCLLPGLIGMSTAEHAGSRERWTRPPKPHGSSPTLFTSGC